MEQSNELTVVNLCRPVSLSVLKAGRLKQPVEPINASKAHSSRVEQPWMCYKESGMSLKGAFQKQRSFKVFRRQEIWCD